MKKYSCLFLVIPLLSLTLYSSDYNSISQNDVINFSEAIKRGDEKQAVEIKNKYLPKLHLLLYSEVTKLFDLSNTAHIYNAGTILDVPNEVINSALEVNDFERLPLGIKNAKMLPQPGTEDFFMIEPDLSKNPQPFPKFNSTVYIPAESIPKHKKYIFWGYHGQKFYSNWYSLAKDIVQGYGVIGIPKNFLKEGLAQTIVVFHPKARKSAFYLFELLMSEKAGSKKNHFQIGLLLGYFEPNVYAFCFGTQKARQEFPELIFTKENEPLEDDQNMIVKRKDGLEKLGDERNIVLHEYFRK